MDGGLDADEVKLWRQAPSLERALAFLLYWRLRNMSVMWWFAKVWMCMGLEQVRQLGAEALVSAFRDAFVKTYT